MKLSLILLWVALWVPFAQAWLPWGEIQASGTLGGKSSLQAPILSHDNSSRPTSVRLSNIYANTFNELEQLKPEPVCHRTAARIIANDCQILEGKDEASVLTDSGRQIRDFVDSYAASLAICDLERGSFFIPAECSKFREESLGRLPVSQQHDLHVSTEEIDACLTGLGKSHSAWITYHNYHDQALRFCEAARADNEKSQSILVSQGIAKVLETLFNYVDSEMEKRMEAAEAVDSLNPNIEKVNEGLARLGEVLFDQLSFIAEDLARVLHRGHEEATSLQKVHDVLLSRAFETIAEMASSHDKSIAMVAASSSALEQRIEQSHQAFMEEFETRQRTLLKNFTTAVEEAASQAATGILNSIGSIADGILGKIVRAIGGEIAGWIAGMISWWPYVVCPVFTVGLGSYGLPPSPMRNLGLMMLGGALGFLIKAAIEVEKV